MRVAEPPWSVQFWFRAIGKRVDPLYRPWVAQQLADPRFLRRRFGPSLVVPVAVMLPQALLALVDHSRLRLIPPALLVVAVAAAAVVNRRRTLSDPVRRRLLAYHGITATGTVVEPTSNWTLMTSGPVGKTGLALIAAQLLVFSTGVAVAADKISTQRACHSVALRDLAALSAVVGQPVLLGTVGSNPPTSVVAPGARLVAAREIDAHDPRVHYVAGYVPDPSGRLVGPAVWTVIEPRSVLNPEAAIAVQAENLPARQITPSTGYIVYKHPNPDVGQARDCAEAAR